jgi:hypothetical protein
MKDIVCKLSNLANELIIHCSSYLEIKDIIHFISTNKRYNSLFITDIVKKFLNRCGFYSFPKDMDLYKVIKDLKRISKYMPTPMRNNIFILDKAVKSNKINNIDNNDIIRLFLANQDIIDVYCGIVINKHVPTQQKIYRVILRSMSECGHLGFIKALYESFKEYKEIIIRDGVIFHDNNNPFYYTRILVESCIKHNNLDIIKFFVSIGSRFNKLEVLVKSAKYDHLDIFIYLLSLCSVDEINQFISRELNVLITYGNIVCLKYIVDSYSVAIDINEYEDSIYNCINDHRLDMMIYFISINATSIKDLFRIAMRCGKVDIIKFLISMGAEHLNDDDYIACICDNIRKDNLEMIKYFDDLFGITSIGLYVAIKSISINVIKWYIDNDKFDINSIDIEDIHILYDEILSKSFYVKYPDDGTFSTQFFIKKFLDKVGVFKVKQIKKLYK